MCKYLDQSRLGRRTRHGHDSAKSSHGLLFYDHDELIAAPLSLFALLSVTARTIAERRHGGDQNHTRDMNDSFHGESTATASTSTSMSLETSAFTSTMLVAGRIAPKNSPCARPTFSQSPIFVT